MLGAALTALGASESSHILIAVFGATNTIIAGLIAYLKSRGQPMRSRMYRDDLERVVDEIENSEVMWLGIAKNIHGYDDIDTDDKVTVRSEVARLMRLYERALRSNMANNPDNYLLNAGSDGPGTALRIRPAGDATVAPVALPQFPQGTLAATQPVPALVPAIADPDESPATAPPKPPTPPPADDAAKTPVQDASKDAKKDTKAMDEARSKSTEADSPATNESRTKSTADSDSSPALTAPAPPKGSDTASANAKQDDSAKQAEDKANVDK